MGIWINKYKVIAELMGEDATSVDIAAALLKIASHQWRL